MLRIAALAIQPLANVTNLSALRLDNTQVSDLTLANLPNFFSLGLVGTPVSDLTPLANLKSLTQETSIRAINMTTDISCQAR